MEKKKIHISGKMPCDLAVSHIECFLDGIRSGSVVIEEGHEKIVLHPDAEIEMNIEAKTKYDKQRLVISLEWATKDTSHPHSSHHSQEKHKSRCSDKLIKHVHSHGPGHHDERYDGNHHSDHPEDFHSHYHSHKKNVSYRSGNLIKHNHVHNIKHHDELYDGHHGDHHSEHPEGFHSHYHCHGKDEHQLCHTHEHAEGHHDMHHGCCQGKDHEPHDGCCAEHHYGATASSKQTDHTDTNDHHGNHVHGYRGCCEGKTHTPHAGCCAEHNYGEDLESTEIKDSHKKKDSAKKETLAKEKSKDSKKKPATSNEKNKTTAAKKKGK